MMRNGYTEEQICKRLGVSVASLNVYKAQFPELVESLQQSREVADSLVEKSLYKSALEGNTTAQIFWLKNRKGKEWREKQEIEHSGEFKVTVEFAN